MTKAPATVTKEPAPLTCAFGTPWADHFNGTGCPRCREMSEALGAQCQAAIDQGIYDEQGYTPAERQAQARRRAKEQA